MHRSNRVAAVAILSVVVAGLWACGDGPTRDHRGYTKAPLERPGIRITPEQPTGYRQFAHPRLPDGQPITLPDTSAAL